MTSHLISHITDSCCIWNTQRKAAPPPKTGRQKNSGTAWQIKLLEVDALWLGAEILIFQRIRANCLQSPALQSFEKSGKAHPMTQHHIPEEIKHQQHHCENIKTCIFGHTYSVNFSLFPFISRNIHACTSLTLKDHKLWWDCTCAASVFNVLNTQRDKNTESVGPITSEHNVTIKQHNLLWCCMGLQYPRSVEENQYCKMR